MRAFIDTNILISFLLKPESESPPAAILRLGFSRAYTLLISQTVVTELRSKVAGKPYLASRIRPDEIEAFAALLAEAVEVVSEIPEALPAVGRDRKDDYLVAHALISNADFLVSGDNDVLSLTGLAGLRIIEPRTFLAFLQDTGLA